MKTPILNVNDSDAVRYMVSRMLKSAGYDVLEAGHGRVALQLIAERQPRLVVLDIKLPDINGLEICREIKSRPEMKSIKVLHTSAVFVSPEFKVKSLESGADGYLTHPFEQEELIATVASLLRLSETEQSLRRTAAELTEANRRVREFLAMLGHELRNPLSAITTSLPLLERNPPADHIEAMARGVIRRQTQQLRRHVDDLLDVARVTRGKIEPRWEIVDLSAVLTRTAANARRGGMDAARQRLALELPGQPLFVRGDSVRLEQIFANLLDNASKYTDEGGEINVGVHVDPADPGRLTVCIKDSGIGIASEDLQKIFELFSQVDVPLARSRGGLGIGLTLVKSLVELHGGSVRAHSAGRGSGSTFEVTLPLSAGAMDGADRAGHPHLGTNGRPRKVAIVEDNADVRQSLCRLIESWGHEVLVAGDGRAGIDLIRTTRPDLALIDIGLPEVDGFEVARSLRTDGADGVPFLVALTGYGAAEQGELARRAGFDLHLPKPAEPAQLAELIRALPEAAPSG